ncbi:MAG: M14 family zinc carboxypeptidase [Candidatus Neomarinimicrobiota bacterium]
MKYILLFLSFNLLSSQSLDERYHTTEELYSYLDSLNQLESIQNFFHLDTIGYSTQENIPIIGVRISDNAAIKEDEPRVLFIGQVHAEEILGVEIIVSLIDKLLFPDANSYTHINILKEYLDIWLIPTANPEGLNVVHEGLDFSFRKNKRDLSSSGPYPNGIFDYDPSIGNDIDGVDLNRNFDFNWAFGDTFLEPDNSDYASHYDYYKGEQAFSESESIAIRDLALDNDFTFSIVWHSSRSGNLSEKVFSSWKWEEEKESPDLNIIKPIADQFASLIDTEDGTSTYLSVFSGSRNGKLHDWFYHETGCIQYLVECGTANLQPDSILIENTIERNLPAMFYLMDRTIGYYADASQLTGRVYDANTNEPIQNAVVEIMEHSGSVLKPRLTNEFGRYRRILDVGTYNMHVKAKGYDTQILTLVANNSAITNQDVFLEKSDLFNLSFELLNDSYDQQNFSGSITDIFDKSMIEISSGQNNFELPKGTYKVEFYSNSQIMPWSKNITLNSDLNFKIPYQNSNSINLNNFENWQTINGSWVHSDSTIHSQLTAYYENSDTTIISNWMESNTFNVSGSNRLTVQLKHKFETEWDHDLISISILNGEDSLLNSVSWSGHEWNEYQTSLLSATSIEGFTDIKIRLDFRPDQSVNYRGWVIKEIEIHSIFDNFLKVEEIKETYIPKIPLKINNIYPNPSNGNLRMSVSGLKGKELKIKIFNILGQEIESLSFNEMIKGRQFFDLNLNNLGGVPSGSGMIFIRLETKKEQVVKKCIIIKN